MRRLIAAAVHNPVTTNLLMLMLIVVGAWSAANLRRESLPQVAFDIIQVQVPFEGAAPDEVEEGVLVKIEEAIQGIEGIRKIFSSAYEGIGFVLAELEPGTDNRRVLDDMEAAVDKIDTFPEDAEAPRFTELATRRQVINVAVFGDQPERTLKEVASQVRDDLLATPAISQVRIYGTRDYEIIIEVSEAALQRYGLTFDRIRDIVRRSSLNLSGGDIKTPTQDVVVRTAGQRYTGQEFAVMPLVTRTDGTVITLDNVARIVDGFAEAERVGRFNGQPAVLVTVFQTQEEDTLAIAETVRQYVADKQKLLPPGLSLSVWSDTSQVVTSRLQLLTNNGLLGLLLVMLCLWLFMNFRLAFWVAAGLPVAFLSAFWFLSLYGSTLNMITMFACIMALGILVDDAIVVGENVYSHWRRGKSPVQAAIDGASEVAIPVLGAVATTIAAFMPLLLMEGILGKFIAVLPVAMIAALLASLVECLIILPPHLAHSLPASSPRHAQGVRRWLQGLRQHIDAAVTWLIEQVYRPALYRAMQVRVIVVAAAMALLLLMIGLVIGGHLDFFLFPKTDADTILARLTLPQGTPLARTMQVAERIETAAWELNQHFRPSDPKATNVVQQVMTIGGIHATFDPEVGSHASEVTLELLPSERRGVLSTALVAKWRALVGDVPEALALTFDSVEVYPGGMPIEVRLIGDDFTDLRQATERLKAELATYPGVLDIQDDFRPGKMEMHLALKPEGRILGFTLRDLAVQVNQGFFGAEALRIQRGREEVKVVIRYPAAERRALGDLDTIRLRAPDGSAVPFSEVAAVTMQRGYAVIKRSDRHRMIAVTADVDTTAGNAEKILADLQANFLPPLLANYQNMRYTFEGQHQETQRSVGSLVRGFILAMLIIYAILAAIFQSYVQPVVVMSVIPFGIIGAVVGHLLFGKALTMMSLFGIVALSGVVVNDSLVLVDFINRTRRRGVPLFEAVLAGGRDRFRAIMLTSLTTVAGLSPILAEKSFQAQFLIPMAISISFGLMGATFLVLFLVPALYLLLYDGRDILHWLATGRWPATERVDISLREVEVRHEHGNGAQAAPELPITDHEDI